MKTIVVVKAPGLTPEQAVRGDVAWTLSDLIADGSFATFSAPPDAAGALPGSGAALVEIPYTDAGAFDAALAEVRRSHAGASLVIVSEKVFVSQHGFKDFRPGTVLAPGDLGRLLAEMLR
jgi:hypothetical protein